MPKTYASGLWLMDFAHGWAFPFPTSSHYAPNLHLSSACYAHRHVNVWRPLVSRVLFFQPSRLCWLNRDFAAQKKNKTSATPKPLNPIQWNPDCLRTAFPFHGLYQSSFSSPFLPRTTRGPFFTAHMQPHTHPHTFRFNFGICVGYPVPCGCSR